MYILYIVIIIMLCYIILLLILCYFIVATVEEGNLNEAVASKRPKLEDDNLGN